EGRVLLTGTVRSEEARLALTDKASRMTLISEVLNEVIVGAGTPVGQGAKDALIDQRLSAALVADNAVYSGNYKFSISSGTVYLLGVAQGPGELSRVTGHAQAVDGVRNVVSHVIFVGDPRRR
ncbi:MAG: BON domain-containing protein, partial [Pseudomonadota bacterium]